jgi:hypothetical protein
MPNKLPKIAANNAAGTNTHWASLYNARICPLAKRYVAMKVISILFVIFAMKTVAGVHNCPEYLAPAEARVKCFEKSGHVCHFSLPAELDGEDLNFVAVYGKKELPNDELSFYFTPTVYIENGEAKGVFSAKGKWDFIKFEANYSDEFCGPHFTQELDLFR